MVSILESEILKSENGQIILERHKSGDTGPLVEWLETHEDIVNTGIQKNIVKHLVCKSPHGALYRIELDAETTKPNAGPKKLNVLQGELLSVNAKKQKIHGEQTPPEEKKESSTKILAFALAVPESVNPSDLAAAEPAAVPPPSPPPQIVMEISFGDAAMKAVTEALKGKQVRRVRHP